MRALAFEKVLVCGVDAATFARLRPLLAERQLPLSFVDPATLATQTEWPARALLALGDAGEPAGAIRRARQLREAGVTLPLLVLDEKTLEPPVDLPAVDLVAPSRLSSFTLGRSLAWLGRAFDLEWLHEELARRTAALGGGQDQNERLIDALRQYRGQLTELEAQLATTTAERDALKAQLASGAREAVRAPADPRAEGGDAEPAQRELERLFEALSTLVGGPRVDPWTPEKVLREVATRLTLFEREKAEQQVLIARLSHNLAIQQVDEQLDDVDARRNTLRRLDDALSLAHQARLPLICLLVRIEDLEELRQQFGSVAADFLLVQLAQRFKLSLRHKDLLLRYDTESFVLITDAESPQYAYAHAKRLFDNLMAEPIVLGKTALPFELRIAIVGSQGQVVVADTLLKRAGDLLKRARNLVDKIVIDPQLVKEKGAKEKIGPDKPSPDKLGKSRSPR